MGFLKCCSLLQFTAKKFSTASKPAVMKYLNVAEKNDAAKNIAALLSRGNSNRREGLSNYNKIYEFDGTVFGQQVRMVMTSVSGHLLNYEFVSTYKSWMSCNPVALFDAPIIKSCSQDYQNIKRTLEREVRSCQGLIIWTDCDREGENIGFEVIKVCTDVKPNLIIYRAKFSEITTASVFRALNNLGQPDKNVSDAVDVRQELDLRTGAAFTRLQTLRLQKVFPQKLAEKLISYGSCQFPTLGFVVERYQAIEDFVPEPFWKIRMNHQIKDLVADFTWKRNRLFNKTAVENILDICKENPLATVETVESKPKNKWRPLPLDTVELEKTVSRKLRINAKDTMKIAEKLYTQGFISYPRTETNIFPKELDLVPLVEQQTNDNRWGPFAQGVLASGGPNPRYGRKSDQAHPPIHPIKYVNTLNGNEQRVYEYIVRHFLACVSKDALGHETVVNVDIQNEKFTAKGLFILERNYLEVYIYDKWNAKEIHEYQNGDTFTPTVLDMVESNTAPPKLLTEADLIALMDKHGIGTDATHAEHIDTIKSREYVGLHENMYFVPGTLGMGLVEGYNNIGLEVSLAKPNLRSQFEKDLQLICEGRRNPETVKREQIEKYKAVFITVMEKIGVIDRTLGNRLEEQPVQVAHEQVINNEDHKPILKCPKCNNDIILRSRRNNAGKYLSCVGYPGCKNAIWLPANIDSIEVLDESCRVCGPNVKKLRIKFKQNPFPGDPNPNTICVGGCDLTVLETLNIKPDTVQKTNINPAAVTAAPRINSNRNVPVIPNQRTLNNWITGVDATQNNRNQNGNNGNDNSRNFGSQPGSNENNLPARSFLSPRIQVTNMSSGTVMPIPTVSNVPLRNNTTVNNVNNTTLDGVVRCNCNNEAVMLTTRKVGPNTGRQFYKCQAGLTNGGCDFFLWADANSSTNSRPNNNTTRPSNNTTMGGEPSTGISCHCSLPATLRTVRKTGPNTGRQFYGCSKPQDEGCSFFKWADEGDDLNNRGPGGDDDNDDNNDHPGHSQGWGNSSRWTGGSQTSNRTTNQWKGKSKKKKPSGQPYKNKKAKGSGGRKCGVCGEVGHTKNKCPNNFK